MSEAAAAELETKIRTQVEEIRGLEFRRPVPIEIIDDRQVLEHIRSRFNEFQTPSESKRVQQAFEILGLLPHGMDLIETMYEVMREQAGGFYDPQTGSFYILDTIPQAIAPVVIAHELTHALEDQYYSLDKRLSDVRGNDDQLLARGAVHEGSATLLMTLYMARAMASGDLDASSLQEYFATVQEQSETLERLPAALQRELMVPYLVGPTFLMRGNDPRSTSADYPLANVDRVYDDPPDSSEQILHPSKYWTDQDRDEPCEINLGELGGRVLGRGWARVAEGTLGELTLGVLVGAPTPVDGLGAWRGEAWTNAAASGWGCDRWELWLRGDRAEVLLGTRWDSPADAAEFAAALPADGRLRFGASGDAVAIVGGDAKGRAKRLVSRMLERLTEGPSAAVPLVPDGGSR